jgi:hypothetical protein
MALSDLAVYSEYAYSTMTEMVAQEVEKFNAASQGTIILSPGNNQGDYSDVAKWQKISGLVRRRNAYGSGSVSAKTLVNIVDTMVKVAAGTPPVRIDPSQFLWIQRSPEEAGVVLGTQLAGDMLADMLNTAILGAYAAMVQTTAILYDATGDTPDEMTPSALMKAARKLGDRSGEIAAWVTHSVPMHDFWADNVANATSLFTYGTVSVNRDPFGRVFVVSDSPSLIQTAPSPDTYVVLGLVPGAVIVEKNNDFLANEQTVNGDENIQRTWQAEWSYNLGIKGYAWDKTNGGKSPTDAAIGTTTNWDKYVTSDKDGPGVILKVDFAA